MSTQNECINKIDEKKRYEELQVMSLDFARKGDSATLQKMIKHGLNKNLADEKGNTLLMLATYNGQLECAKMLLELGVDVDKRNDRGQTPLGGVAFKGNLEMVKLLLKFGAKIDADNGGGKTPLLFAAMFGQKYIVAYLIKKGANPKAKTLFGLSINQIAKLTGGVRTVFGA